MKIWIFNSEDTFFSSGIFQCTLEIDINRYKYYMGKPTNALNMVNNHNLILLNGGKVNK